jgi:hypothetical protein
MLNILAKVCRKIFQCIIEPAKLSPAIYRVVKQRRVKWLKLPVIHLRAHHRVEIESPQNDRALRQLDPVRVRLRAVVWAC